MTWEEFRQQARAVAGMAAEKISDVTDIAALRVRLATVEYQLKSAYAAFGKASYEHFTADDASSPEELAKQIEKITLLRSEADALRDALKKEPADGSDAG